MRQQIIELLEKLGLPLSKVESDLQFGNGLLGKIKKEENRKLSEENFEKLKVYFKEKTGSVFFSSSEISRGILKENPVIEETKQVPTKMEVPIFSKNKVGNADKLKALQAAISKLDNEFGKGSVMRLGDTATTTREVVSTGSLRLDAALGVGGLPKGRITEIYGPESAGKTTIALHVIAEAQKRGGYCALIDAEHAFDEEYAKKIGVDTSNFYVSQPSYGEEALEMADKLIASGGVAVIVIDSVAALIPKSESEGAYGDSKMGLHARLMSQACRKLTASISKTNTVVIFINQLREKIGVMFGNPETTTGGNALKFYASVRLDVRKTAMKDGEVVIGYKVKVKVVKNKVAPPFKIAEFDLFFGEGIDTEGEIVDMAVELGLFQKSGSWFSYGTTRLGQGRESVKQLLSDNEELKMEILNKIKNHK